MERVQDSWIRGTDLVGLMGLAVWLLLLIEDLFAN